MLKRITNNWVLKLTSMVLAVALWSHVRGEVNPWEPATFRVPVRVRPPRNMVLSPDSKPPSMIRVTLRGPRSSLRQFKGSVPPNPLAAADEVPIVGSDQIRAYLDFTNARKGRQEVPIVAETDIEDVEVIGVKPATVEVTLDRAESDDYSVRPSFAPAALAELRIAATEISPARAEVFGPSAQLARVVTVRARMDKRDMAPGTHRLTGIPLVALDEDGEIVSGVQVEPTRADLKVTVRERLTTREVRLTPRLKGDLADGFQVTESSVTPSRLTLRGPVRILRDLPPLRATLDVSRASGDVRRRVDIPLPGGVTVIGSERVTVEAIIERVPDAVPDSRDTDVAVAGTRPGTSGQGSAPARAGTASRRTSPPVPDEFGSPARSDGDLDLPVPAPTR